MAPPFLKTGHGRDSRFSFRRRKSGKASPSPSSPLSVSSSASSEEIDPGSPMESSKTQTLPCARRALSRSSCGSRGKLSVDLIPPPLAGGPSDAPRPSTSAPPPKPAPRYEGPPSDAEIVREKFSKLLLGEDMSGTGKGVSSALALSNAITNLAASVFGEQRRLQPMAPEQKARWTKEIDWLLSVADHIVEFVPSRQVSDDGSTMEVMITQQRKDLQMNIPALRKLDMMLLDYLDSFSDKQEFWYVKKDSNDSEKSGDAPMQGDKWWLPTVKVPPNGLSDSSRRWLQHQKELVNQVLKATMSINANVIMEMDVPEAYMESLPKNGKSTLGDSMYKLITDEYFDPEELIATVDLSNEYNIVDLKNRIEASVVIWQKKMTQKDTGKLSWGHGVSHEKRGRFEGRAENVLLLLKHRFPGISQSALDISKIQYNRVLQATIYNFHCVVDLLQCFYSCLLVLHAFLFVSVFLQDVGSAILESYSRTLESLAYTVMSRIEDVLHADSLAQDPKNADAMRMPSLQSDDTDTVVQDAKDEVERLGRMEPLNATLFDYVGPRDGDIESMIAESEDPDGAKLTKVSPIATKRFSYLDKLEHLGGTRSPISRH
ncbi:hypothetical protein ACQ4PT_006525 [Festuca glaucescens]